MTSDEVTFSQRPGDPVFSSDDRLPVSIRELDLGPIVWKLTSDESESASEVDWSTKQTLRVCEEYRKFLTLSLEGNGKVTSPSRNIDIIWHHHILDTQKYYEDCHRIFGHVVHHFPYLGVRGSADRQILLDAYEDTKKRYCARFGQVPEDVWGMAAHCGVSTCSTPTNCSSQF
ncbi:glycine-rich domain-containing protein [Roseovarius sp.]|uniref:glycine-rich domain-containing protein n=1 Tax=Roseovarius sp. TaxID=1486281 RepID=UPI003BAB283D